MPLDTPTAVIGGLIHALAHGLWSLVFEVLRYFHEDRYAERLLGARRVFLGRESSVPVSIVAAKVNIGEPLEPSSENYPGTTGYGELQCLTRLSPWLRRLYGEKRVQVYLSGSPSANDFAERNWILLGGPIYNREVGQLLDRLDVQRWLPVQIRSGTEHEGGGTIVFEAGKRYEAVLADGRVQKDVAVLAKLPNPEDRTKIVLLLIGSRTHGVEYAGRLMTDPELLRSLVGVVGRSFFYTVVPLKVTWEPGTREPSHLEPEGSRIGTPRIVHVD